MTMQISFEKPPIYDEVNKLFKLEERGLGAVFTYGSTIFNPFGVKIPADLLAHEEAHMEQQEGNVDVAAIWWKRYLQDDQFRLDQETEAYGVQYKFYCRGVKDRNKRDRYLRECAKMLSGQLYGNIVGQAEATKLIKDYAQGNFGNE